MSAEMLVESLFGVGAVLRLERDVWSMLKLPSRKGCLVNGQITKASNK